MKKLYTLTTTLIISALTYKAQAQTGDGFSQLIKSTPADATKLVSAYAEPLFKGFGTGMNSGWNNTAKTKGLLKFDLRITANMALIPTHDKSFDVRNLGLSNHVTVDASSPTSIAPTVAGDKNAATPVMRINDDNGVKIGSFNMPKGQVPVIPAPNVQLTVGLVHNTDLTIRAIPKINISDDIGSISMIGFGVKHNIMQDFATKVPKPFDLALAVNYNHLSYTKGLSVQPDGAAPAPGNTNNDFSNQHIDAAFNAINVQAILSKKFLVFTPFLSVGYQSAKTDFGVYGNYPIRSTTTGLGSFYTTVSDPVHINETSVSGLRGDLGFQLNLGFFRFYASYSAGTYQSVNGGIGFGM